MRYTGLVWLLALTACAHPVRVHGFGHETRVLDGQGGSMEVHLERRLQPRPPSEVLDSLAFDVLDKHQPLRRYGFHTLAIAGATVVAFAGESRVLELAVVRGGLVESITPIFGDEVYSARPSPSLGTAAPTSRSCTRDATVMSTFSTRIILFMRCAGLVGLLAPTACTPAIGWDPFGHTIYYPQQYPHSLELRLERRPLAQIPPKKSASGRCASRPPRST